MNQFVKRCLNGIILTIKLNSKMKRILFLFVLVNSIVAAHPQSLADSMLVQYCKKVFYETVLPYEAEMHGGSVIVSETQTGIVKALINFHRHGIDGWSENTDYNCFIPALNSPLALFLALLDADADPIEEFYTTGVLLDERAGVIIRDWNWRYGGVGNITLSQACQRSRVALIEACEKWFVRSQATAAYHLSHTGIYLGDEDESLTDYQSFCYRYEDTPWQPLALLGDNDRLKIIQIHMFTSGLANGKLLMPRMEESDPSVVIYDPMANPEHIEIVRNSMLENVEYGLSKIVKTGVEDVQIWGFSNVSEPNGTCEQSSLFTGFIEKYTITVTVDMFENSLIRIVPQKIASSIINYLTNTKIDMSHETDIGTYKPYRAEK